MNSLSIHIDLPREASFGQIAKNNSGLWMSKVSLIVEIYNFLIFV